MTIKSVDFAALVMKVIFERTIKMDERPIKFQPCKRRKSIWCPDSILQSNLSQSAILAALIIADQDCIEELVSNALWTSVLQKRGERNADRLWFDYVLNHYDPDDNRGDVFELGRLLYGQSFLDTDELLSSQEIGEIDWE